ncbi:putative 1,4-dihydroxy-2-naphthoyl-CoA hydrolase [Medicago truncatula]|uniref:Putative 1,4-dihydroxy-2-naphthoyl-CoA hydrolase n=1 Tax=Medicago truncatula TaxID=3880 RepID=A0A396J8U3_MEDTR|nr:putative 1,4-dihydroxy-2-naphthoyl-CoA hydrolase [Medicago truncatula]
MEDHQSSSLKPKAADLDLPLHTFGFEFKDVSSDKVSGHLQVTEKCCQPFSVLHGGVSAVIAEALASIGAHVACGYKRVAGIQLSINHLKSAMLGDLIYAEATPLSVWDVKIWKIEPSNSQNRSLIAYSRVTLKSNMPVPDYAKEAANMLKKYAKL